MVIGRVAKNLSHLIWMFPADVKYSNSLPSCRLVSALIFLCSLLSTYVVYFFHLCGLGFVCVCVCVCVILLFKIVPQSSAKVLSNVPECKKAVMDSMEKIHLLYKFPSV